jgi:hypothetical protein
MYYERPVQPRYRHRDLHDNAIHATILFDISGMFWKGSTATDGLFGSDNGSGPIAVPGSGDRGKAGAGSCRVARRQAQAREEKLTILRIAQRHVARHDHRGDGAQPDDNRARFVEPAHMGIARGEKAV